ncbi:hypothetical protein OA101_02730 [Alphaproteobacteria bacterium]|jgi:hypothetical protein|nr:hypothetical protein [Alphaproteobacteria bacterium]
MRLDKALQRPIKRKEKIEALRQHMARFEPPAQNGIQTGFKTVDDDLQSQGVQLSYGAVHLVQAKRYGDVPAALGFATYLASRFAVQGPILWGQTRESQREIGMPYAMSSYGVDWKRFWYVDGACVKDLFWALEEAVSCREIGCVVGVCGSKMADFKMSRRLTLVAQKSGCPILLVVPPRTNMQPIAAASKWYVQASENNTWDLSLQNQLRRHVGGTASWRVNADAARHSELDAQTHEAQIKMRRVQKDQDARHRDDWVDMHQASG